MSLEFSLDELVISDGTHVRLDRDSIVIFVGPNNSGKSQALRDIRSATDLMETLPVVLTATVNRVGDVDNLLEWLAEHTNESSPPGYREPVYQRPGITPIRKSDVLLMWDGKVGGLSKLFVFMGEAEQRLQLANSSQSFDAQQEPPNTPLQTLYVWPNREEQLARASVEAFGSPITVNRFAGNAIHLHFGGISSEVGLATAQNVAYQKALRALPLVQDQGDGVRSFTGVMLALLAANYPIVLIDEPEAFLHPPQARLLGRKLGQQAPRGSQLAVATHSADVLQGVLDAPAGRVTVVRLTRANGVNSASVLEHDQIRQLWRDPLLRYSRLFEGLFHSGVVVCESDADCRFYAAVLDAELRKAERRPHDLLFTHAGGIHRFPVLIGALRAVRVPIRAIADIDVLRDENLLRAIVDALGAAWEPYERDWRIVTAAVTQDLGPNPPIADVRRDINEVLLAASTDRLDRTVAERIRNVVKAEDGWARVRSGGGTSAFPRGMAAEAGARLVDGLANVGLDVVPVGELERWEPSVPGHGPSWVNAALEQDLHERGGSAAQFMSALSDRFAADDAGGGVPPRSADVVDEAFDHSEDEFTVGE